MVARCRAALVLVLLAPAACSWEIRNRPLGRDAAADLPDTSSDIVGDTGRVGDAVGDLGGDAGDVPVAPGAVRQLAAGGDHTCAVLGNGSVRCWGRNDSSQLGMAGGTAVTDAGIPIHVAPVTVPGVAGVDRMVAGYAFNCVLTASGQVWCWGANMLHQLGGMTVVNSATPLAVAGLGTTRVLGAGMSHACAIRDDQSVRCWGYNSAGQIGQPSGSPRGVTVPITYGDAGLLSAIGVGAGDYHTCAIVPDGTARCWGQNTFGQLGTGRTSTADWPEAVLEMGPIAQMGGGTAHTCARLADGGLVRCWGTNLRGQLGSGTDSNSSLPTDVLTSSGALQIAVGRLHGCLLQADRHVWCWGANDNDQVGAGSEYQYRSPVEVPALSDVVEIAAGGHHTCARRMDGVVLCWGSNSHGQLGDGTTISRLLPMPVLGL